MKNNYNNVFHLNKLPGHKCSSPVLLSSLLRDRTGKIYTVCCNAYALSFIFARIFNDDLSPRRTASVLASCTLQSAILFRTAKSIQQYGSTEWNWRSIVRELREFVVIFKILTIQERMKEQRNYVLQILQVVALTTGMLYASSWLFHTSTTLELELLNCALFYRTKFEFSFVFTVTVL